MFGFGLNQVQLWVAIAVVSAIAYLAWDYAHVKSSLASRNAEISRLKTSIKAIETTNTLNLEALRRLDDSCVNQLENFLNLRDIDKIIKESADPINEALKFDPKAKRKE